jgi:preprotein translocase subunit SecG
MPVRNTGSRSTDEETFSVLLNAVIIGLHLLASIVLIVFILLHAGRGGGLSDMFGGGVTSSLGASGVAERNLNRITIILGLVWFATIIVLGLILRFTGV